MQIKNLFIITLICSVLFSTLVQGRVEFFSQKIFINNETQNSHRFIKNNLFLAYDKGGAIAGTTTERSCLFFGFFCSNITLSEEVQGDFIPQNNPLEVFIRYSAYPKTWNTANTLFQVEFCNLSVFYLPTHNSNASLVFNRITTPNDEDVRDAQFFQRLNDGDAIRAEYICKFANPQTIMDIPADLAMNSPTWECKACQFFEFTQKEIDIQKAETLGDHTVEISTFIRKLINLNFEIVLALFWTALIFLLFIAVHWLFLGLYFIFISIRRIST